MRRNGALTMGNGNRDGALTMGNGVLMVGNVSRDGALTMGNGVLMMGNVSRDGAITIGGGVGVLDGKSGLLPTSPLSPPAVGIASKRGVPKCCNWGGRLANCVGVAPPSGV